MNQKPPTTYSTTLWTTNSSVVSGITRPCFRICLFFLTKKILKFVNKIFYGNHLYAVAEVIRFYFKHILFPPTAAFSSWLWTWVYFPPAKSVVLERKCMHTFSNKNNPNMVLNFFPHLLNIDTADINFIRRVFFYTSKFVFICSKNNVNWSFPLQNQRYQCKKAQNTSKQIEREFDFIWHVA